MDKYIVNIYNIINIRVVSEDIKIYDNLDDMIKTIENINPMDEELILFCYLKDMVDMNKRMKFLMDIEKCSLNMEIKKKLELNNFMILNNGNVSKIREFSIVSDNLEKIENIGIEDLKNRDLKIERDLCEKEISNKENDDLTRICYTVRLTNLFNLMEERFDNNKDEMLNDLEDNIIEIREKNLEKNMKNKIMKNEFDIINEAIKSNLKKNEIENLEILKCVYNGEEISHEELINELLSHVFPEFLKEKNIEDTLDDVYEINTNYLTIKRVEGGELLIKRNIVDDE